MENFDLELTSGANDSVKHEKYGRYNSEMTYRLTDRLVRIIKSVFAVRKQRCCLTRTRCILSIIFNWIRHDQS